MWGLPLSWTWRGRSAPRPDCPRPPAGRRSLDGKLSGAQTALLLQEETLHRSERERKALAEKVAGLERGLQAAESERRATQVGGCAVGLPWCPSAPPVGPPPPGG